jgi:hypothetical protein
MSAKKVKLTPEEKAEIKKEKKSWAKMVSMAKKKGALIE